MSIDTIKNYFADTHCSCAEQKKKKKLGVDMEGKCTIMKETRSLSTSPCGLVRQKLIESATEQWVGLKWFTTLCKEQDYNSGTALEGLYIHSKYF